MGRAIGSRRAPQRSSVKPSQEIMRRWRATRRLSPERRRGSRGWGGLPGFTGPVDRHISFPPSGGT
jgi:hypothetical protein